MPRTLILVCRVAFKSACPFENKGGLDLKHWIKIALFLIIVTCLLSGLPAVLGFSAEDASMGIAGAKRSLQIAFVNVSGAENAGGNVSALLIQLNEAGSDLTMAEVAFSNSNYSEAVNQAHTCKALADSIASEAATMENQAGDRLSRVLPVLVGGFIGSVALIVVLALTWLWFKRHSTGRLLRSRPKVTV